MDIESQLEKLKTKVAKERVRENFKGSGYSQGCRRAILKLAAEIGIPKVSDAIGISGRSIYGWRSQAGHQEDDDAPQIDVTRVSVHSHAVEPESNVVARFWIGENAVEILSADVVFELARRSFGGMA